MPSGNTPCPNCGYIIHYNRPSNADGSIHLLCSCCRNEFNYTPDSTQNHQCSRCHLYYSDSVLLLHVNTCDNEIIKAFCPECYALLNFHEPDNTPLMTWENHLTLTRNNPSTLMRSDDLPWPSDCNITCPSCHQTYFTNDLNKVYSDHTYLCSNCNHHIPPYGDDNLAPDSVECHHCHKEIDLDDATLAENFYYCKDCLDELFTICEHCENTIRQVHAITEDGITYCQDCYERLYATCESCGETIQREGDDTYFVRGNFYCQSCYDDNFVICDQCGEVVAFERTICRNGHTICQDCVPTNRPFSLRRVTLPRGQFRYGIELETSECPDCNELEGKTCFGCKTDSSIDGMEFISPPLAGKEGFEKIDQFISLADARGFDVDDKCGYHLHLNMDGKAIESMQKVAYAYYLTEDIWQLFIREDRRDNHYCQKIAWSISDIFRIETHSEFINFCNSGNHGDVGRYCWLNVTSYTKHKTFEIRSHEGTLDADAIKNWIKLHIAFCDWAMKHSFTEIENKLTKITLDTIKGIIKDDNLVNYYAKKIGLGATENEPQLQVA